jgi:hypothetical protein
MYSKETPADTDTPRRGLPGHVGVDVQRLQLDALDVVAAAPFVVVLELGAPGHEHADAVGDVIGRAIAQVGWGTTTGLVA